MGKQANERAHAPFDYRNKQNGMEKKKKERKIVNAQILLAKLKINTLIRMTYSAQCENR